jgi:hypothetical protein
MKFPKLKGLTGQEAIDLHTNFFGNKKPFAKFDKDQLEKIEAALETNDVSGLTQKIADLDANIINLNAVQAETQNAIDQALQLNGITIPEGATTAEAIIALGAKCKEYGSSENRHVTPKNNGEEKPENNQSLIDGYFDPKAPHNQVNL